MKVNIYLLKCCERARRVTDAIRQGIARYEDVRIVPEIEYREPSADVAVFYGFERQLPKVMADYKAIGRNVVYIDLGYWGRKTKQDRFGGYHKLSINDRHPTAYFDKRKHDGSRAQRFGMAIKAWRNGGRHIVLAGMGDKAARVQGYAPCEWERGAIAELRKYTDRPIVYRPKPSWKDARPLEGTEFNVPITSIESVLHHCHALVTHHSNAGVDAAVHGVPVFTVEGVASRIGTSDLSRIEDPVMPVHREQWINDIAWTQWNAAEMQDGSAWRHLRDEGLV